MIVIHVCWARVKDLFSSLMREKQDGKSGSKKSLGDWDYLVTERKNPGIRHRLVSVLQGKNL